ncbi:hypothetical protein [Virgibacillus salexigens]|uniref:Phosphatase n=1 Tax=Virgibacillus kapii TaxID=1638645 RepID=A0ABQ2DNI4_9BACI|nr:hypothetical protein [Virgibacillus kapii]GGJ64669.1 hypothetical protein GCM10007111_28180 [Virgibacillus kapii]
MKKLFATLSFSAVLVAGFVFVSDQSTDSAMNMEPEVFSVELPTSQL